MDLLSKIPSVSKAQSERSQGGDEPFKITSRLLDEYGEVSWGLNHFERKNISIERECKDHKDNLVVEAYHVMMVLGQLLQYFDLTNDLINTIESVYKEYRDKGYIKQ